MTSPLAFRRAKAIEEWRKIGRRTITVRVEGNTLARAMEIVLAAGEHPFGVPELLSTIVTLAGGKVTRGIPRVTPDPE